MSRSKLVKDWPDALRSGQYRQDVLMKLNDELKFTFPEIADFVERAGWANE